MILKILFVMRICKKNKYNVNSNKKERCFSHCVTAVFTYPFSPCKATNLNSNIIRLLCCNVVNCSKKQSKQ